MPTAVLHNNGRFRVDGSAAIANHPQVPMLGFGRLLDRPWVVDGKINIRKIAQMPLVFDHRSASAPQRSAPSAASRTPAGASLAHGWTVTRTEHTG